MAGDRFVSSRERRCLTFYSQGPRANEPEAMLEKLRVHGTASYGRAFAGFVMKPAKVVGVTVAVATTMEPGGGG